MGESYKDSPMERLASRHPTNGCSPFAGTLPHLGFNAPSARVEAARSSITSFIPETKNPNLTTASPALRAAGASAPSQAFWPQAKTLAQGGFIPPGAYFNRFPKRKIPTIRLGFFFLERATRLELASRHPTNGCSPFAGTLPHLGFNAPSARVEAARSSIHHSFQKQKIPT